MDPTSRLITLGAAGVAGVSDYWIGTYGSGSGTSFAYGIHVDSSGDIYVGGQTNAFGAGSVDCLIAKYDSYGVIQWERTLGGTGYDTARALAVDGSGNSYITGYVASAGAGSYDCQIVKYNSSGTIQWQRTLGGTNNDYGRAMATDSSGNVYVGGQTESAGAGSSDFLIAKYNSSGTIQWQRTLGDFNLNAAWGMASDSSGNVYLSGRTSNASNGGYDILIAKYNTSGTIQWQRTLGGSSTDIAHAIHVDSSGNVYVVGYTASAGPGGNSGFIAKYNNSGAIQWQRSLGGLNTDYLNAVTTDSSGNVYVTGQTNSVGQGNYDVIVAKYNSSGTIQWQRILGGPNNDVGEGITVDNSGIVYVTGYSSSMGDLVAKVLILKLPDDGSLTGTYGPLVYASSSLTDAASSLTDGASSFTDSASSLTDAAASMTDAASSLTSSITYL